ncbi:unnamed protein product, partial [Ceratitis capitata]
NNSPTPKYNFYSTLALQSFAFGQREILAENSGRVSNEFPMGGKITCKSNSNCRVCV